MISYDAGSNLKKFLVLFHEILNSNFEYNWHKYFVHFICKQQTESFASKAIEASEAKQTEVTGSQQIKILPNVILQVVYWECENQRNERE